MRKGICTQREQPYSLEREKRPGAPIIFTPEQESVIVDRYLATGKYTVIAKTMAVDPDVILRVLKKNGAYEKGRSRLGQARNPHIDGDVVRIPTQLGTFGLADAADFHLISGRPWHATQDGYLACDFGGKLWLMHRFLNQSWKEVDHINGNRADNRRENLRECNRSQNNANATRRRKSKSGYKGVWYSKSTGKWHAEVAFNGKKYSAGSYHRTARDAAIAYDNKATEVFGQFALTNKSMGIIGPPQDGEGSRRERRCYPPIDWDLVAPDLGMVHDCVVAARCGTSSGAVGVARRKRGIPPFRKPT